MSSVQLARNDLHLPPSVKIQGGRTSGEFRAEDKSVFLDAVRPPDSKWTPAAQKTN